jgi:hypothetical protein
MARSIHKPWLKLWVQGILNDNINSNDNSDIRDVNANISNSNSNKKNNNQNSTITTSTSTNYHKNIRNNRNKNNISRIVQVMSCNEEARCMLISDTEYCIHIFFKKDIFESILNDYNIDSVKYSLIKISNKRLVKFLLPLVVCNLIQLSLNGFSYSFPMILILLIRRSLI